MHMNNPNTFFSAFIEEVVGQEHTHFFWLRALSYLEYIGYRKMVKALPFDAVSTSEVHHLGDEIQHSLMLKQMARKVFGHLNLAEPIRAKICGISEEYFQSLDSSINDYLQKLSGYYDPYRTYAYVSYVIELRAMQTYPAYLQCLGASPIKIIVQKIIQDESDHLHHVKKLIGSFEPPAGLTESDMLALEDVCFKNFIKAFRTHLLQ